MERDDRDMRQDADPPVTEVPMDGPSADERETSDPGATSQDRPGGARDGGDVHL